jgi:hypothetical protein
MQYSVHVSALGGAAAGGAGGSLRADQPAS